MSRLTLAAYLLSKALELRLQCFIFSLILVVEVFIISFFKQMNFLSRSEPPKRFLVLIIKGFSNNKWNSPNLLVHCVLL